MNISVTFYIFINKISVILIANRYVQLPELNETLSDNSIFDYVL